MPSNAPYGFRPHRHLEGGLIRHNEYPIATGYATTIFSGDPVKLLSDGTLAQAAAGDRILGIFQGCSYTASDGSFVPNPIWPASTTATNIKAQVIDDPKVTYRVQSAGTPAVTNTGNLADHVVGTGSTMTGLSGSTLDSSMGTGAAGWRVLRLVDEPGNSGQFASLEVQLHESELAYHGQATVGV